MKDCTLLVMMSYIPRSEVEQPVDPLDYRRMVCVLRERTGCWVGWMGRMQVLCRTEGNKKYRRVNGE